MTLSRRTKIKPGTIVRRKVAGKEEGGISHYRIVISEAMDCPKQSGRKVFLTASLTSPKRKNKVELHKKHWYADKSEVGKQNDISHIDYTNIFLLHEEKNGDIERGFKVFTKSYVTKSGLDIIIGNLEANINVEKKLKPNIQKFVDKFLSSLNN